MAAACGAAGIEFIVGTELTAEHNETEVHLLGYLMDTQNKRLLVEIARFQSVRQNRIREMVARLNQLNVPLEAETVFALANCKSPGRPHLARALVKAGLCKSSDEAFERFLKKNRPAWVPKAKMSALEGVELIHQAGGLAVMAHPGLNRTDEIIPALVDAGLDGIECFHTKHSTKTAERYLEIADKYNLLVTGGSDCHGFSKGKPLIGTVKLPYEHVEKLKAKAESRGSKAGIATASALDPRPSTLD
jgi:predicted metal-dependent phosphoesterase TrpH